MVLWFIGKSASGKTFFGEKLYSELSISYPNLVYLDGDILRNTLSKDLGHSQNDRFISEERRSRLSKLLSDQNIHVIVSGISNEPEIRDWNKKNIKDYYEIYLRSDKSVLYNRDPKKIYRKFLEGKITDVVGEDIKFNEPIDPWITIENNGNDSKKILNKIINKIKSEIL